MVTLEWTNTILTQQTVGSTYSYSYNNFESVIHIIVKFVLLRGVFWHTHYARQNVNWYSRNLIII